MSWSAKVDDTTARDSVIAAIASDLGSADETTVTRSDLSSFLDGTETVEDCFEFCAEQLYSSTDGWSVELGNFSLADSDSELTLKTITN
jgi:hypothetical protein